MDLLLYISQQFFLKELICALGISGSCQSAAILKPLVPENIQKLWIPSPSACFPALTAKTRKV
jgi:hypothetical protein